MSNATQPPLSLWQIDLLSRLQTDIVIGLNSFEASARRGNGHLEQLNTVSPPIDWYVAFLFVSVTLSYETTLTKMTCVWDLSVNPPFRQLYMNDFSQRKNIITAKRKQKSCVSRSFCFQIFTKQKKDPSKSFDSFLRNACRFVWISVCLWKYVLFLILF